MNELKPSSISNGTFHLLEKIKTIWATVGESLTDAEFNYYLHRAGLPEEAGFSFLSFFHGHAVLNVPRQDLADWYPAQGLIEAGKEKIAKAIAKKYGLLFYEPADASPTLCTGSNVVHHHFTLADRRQNVVIAHPLFLKICVFGKPLECVYGRDALFPLPLGPDLLQDLSTLYQRRLDSPVRTNSSHLEVSAAAD
jgi:hypothetical protein